MEIVIRTNKKYKFCFKYPHYRVKVKFLFFWVTVKTFTIGRYSIDACFCFRECEELYDKIVNPYGKF